MSVVGIDFGNHQSVIAVARNRGIDIVINEVSRRSTPSLVGFGPKQRFLGESAKSQEIMNIKNTIPSLQRIIGRTYTDQEFHQNEAFYFNSAIVEKDKKVAFRVNYQNQEYTFTGTEIVAMYLTQLRLTVEKATGAPMSDVVISIPAFFTDSQRRAVMDACSIAGLKCLKLMHDYTATALTYGLTKNELFTDQSSNVVFVDAGYASTTVSVVSFTKSQLDVRGVACHPQLGGRDLDNMLINHFIGEIKKNYNLDVTTNPKAMKRLRSSCEKMKTVLSANSEAPLNIESIMNDIDIRGFLKREDFEAMMEQPVLQPLDKLIQEALNNAGLGKEDINVIEMVGGSSRVPAIKKRVANFFCPKEPTFTTNQEESVARGCAFQCAMLSPVFRVKDFAVNDISLYPIKLVWGPPNPENDNEIEVFKRFNSIPSVKQVTLYHKEPFSVEVAYSDMRLIPLNINSWIGSYFVKNIEPSPSGGPAEVLIKLKLDASGIVTVLSAYIANEEEIEVVEEEKPDASAPMQTDEAQKDSSQEASPPASESQEESKSESNSNVQRKPKKKKVIRKIDVPVIGGSSSLLKDELHHLRENELNMIAADKLVYDTAERRNALEEYVYYARNKLYELSDDKIDENLRSDLISRLTGTEDWLYEDGEDASLGVYNAKLDELKQMIDPIIRPSPPPVPEKAAEADESKSSTEQPSESQQQQDTEMKQD